MRNKTNIFVKAAVAVFICFCLITIVRLNIEYNELETERENIDAQINDYVMRIEELKDELSRPYDDEYIIRVAREKLNYHLPEEIIFYNDLNK